MYDCVHTLVLIDFCSRNNFRHSCENGELRRYSLTQTLPSSPLKLAQPSGHLAIYVMTLIFGVVRSCCNYTGAVRTGLSEIRSVQDCSTTREQEYCSPRVNGVPTLPIKCDQTSSIYRSQWRDGGIPSWLRTAFVLVVTR